MSALAVERNSPPMATKIASTAAMGAISVSVSVESMAAMDKEFYTRLGGYYSAMAQANQMLGKGIISADEYATIDTIMAKKYGLSSCSLFRDNGLLYRETDGNM